jgi:hypothetical protein
MVYPRHLLRRRYRSLAVLELLNVALFPTVLFVAVEYVPSPANVAGTLATCALLVVGSAYWWAKLRQLDEGTPLPRGLRIFSAAQRACGAMIVCATGAVTAQAAASDGWGSWAPGLVMLILSILEYINYFHLQLSHDNRYDLQELFRHGLRRSKLSRDLAAWRAERTVDGR